MPFVTFALLLNGYRSHRRYVAPSGATAMMAVVPPAQCKLLTGPAAASAQLLLAVAAFSVLLYKRSVEHPQRPYKVWSMDVSKQVVSSAAAHGCGMVIAVLASRAQAHEVSSCAWYFVAFSFDTTLGVSIAIIFHKAAVKWAKQMASRQGPDDMSWQKSLAECGSYGDPPSFRRFYIQLAEFSVAVIVGRVICGSMVILGRGILIHVAAVLDRLFYGHPTALLYFVMVMCPLCMNLIQALVQDAVLKFKKDGKESPKTQQSLESDSQHLLSPRNASAAGASQQVRSSPVIDGRDIQQV